MDYKKFYEYFNDLYGEGLAVYGWNLNGTPVPLDNFIESACEYAEENLQVEEKSGEREDIWQSLPI